VYEADCGDCLAFRATGATLESMVEKMKLHNCKPLDN